MNPIGYVAAGLLAVLIGKRALAPAVTAAPISPAVKDLVVATVAGRSYSVLRMGGGNYTITRLNGAAPAASYIITQTGPLGDGVGDPADLAQLKLDMQNFPSNMFTGQAVQS
jgi:hypothetical protein